MPESTILPLLAESSPAVGVCHVEPNELVLANYQAVYRFAFRLCGCMASAEDITQETFLQALKHLHQLRSGQAQLGWLLAIGRRIYFRRLSQAKAAAVQSLDSTNAEIEEALASQAGRDAGQQIDDEDLIQVALNQLGPDARMVVVMYYFEELSYQEIASQLQIPIGTVMSRLSRSREALRRVLDAPAVHHTPASAKAKESQRHG